VPLNCTTQECPGPVFTQNYTFTNATGQTASDLHILFNGPVAQPFLFQNAPGCPSPVFTGAGGSNTLDVDWGVACVDNGESVVIELSSEPPSSVQCFHWTIFGSPIGTPCDPSSPTPTPSPSPTPSPTPPPTPTANHDVGRAGGGFSTAGRAPGTSTSADVNVVKIKVKNFGAIAETEVRYAVSGSCTIDSNGDTDTLDCGSVTYTAACSGNAAAISGDGDLDPAEVVSVSGCTATYGPNAPANTGDSWTHVLVITHCGTATPPCTTGDGGIDSNPTNNMATKNTKVLP
jgi:hypothetical protein